MALPPKHRHLIRIVTACIAITALILTPFATIGVQAAPQGRAHSQQPDGPTTTDGRGALDTSALIQAETSEVATDKKSAATATGKGIVASANAAALDTYIVILEGAAVPSYQGGVNGLAPTSPKVTGSQKLNLRAAESIAYERYLEQQQVDVIGHMDRTLNRNVEIIYRYQNALNGFAAKLASSEVDQVSKLAGVKAVIPDWIETKETDAGPEWEGATAIWGGNFTDLAYKADLSGANEVPPVTTAASGSATFHYNMDTKELTYEVTVADITGITASHIHAGVAGENGPVLFPLFTGNGAFDPDNPISGAVTLNMEQQALLVNGGLYVNVHTGANPGGEIRSQILLDGSMGEGIVVGIVDTGINIDHPSFADIGGDGYDHTNARGKFYGWCDPENEHYDPALACNDKLIGMWSGDDDSPEDADGHGSHTGSTVAGNVLEDVVIHAPTTDVTVHRISGVAPHANVIGYNIEAAPGTGSATGAAIVAATEQAIEDGVDVINYSFGGSGADPWVSAEHWYNVRAAGIFVATSAGNSGAAADTVGSPANAPWLMTVAASSHNRQFSNVLMGLTGGDTTPPADIVGEGLTSGYGPAPIVYAGAVDPNNVGCDIPYPPGTFNGEIVVCDYNSGPQYGGRVNKSVNLKDGGAGGFILVNRPDYKAALMVDSYAVPGMGVPYDQGEALKAWLASGGGHMGTIRGVETEPARGDIMAGFSSRGPNGPLPDVIKPDITAPGRRIVAAVASTDGSIPPEFDVYQGTSMSSPHAAGAAALLRAIHPAWTPAEVQSALMTTALYDGILKEDAATQADPFDMGAGRVDLTKAAHAGLVLDETPENLWAANPAEGGDPKALNLPSLANTQCLLSCSWTRTVKSTLDVAETWTASGSGGAGVTISVEPAQFTIEPGATQEIVITANTSGAPLGEWLFGKVDLTPAGNTPAAHLPVALISATGILPDAVDIETRRDAGSQLIEGLRATTISDLTVNAYGLTSGNVVDFALTEDPTNGDPYDNINDGTVAVYNVTVPEGALLFSATILASTAPDLDMYVGMGSTPSAATEVCISASGIALESCQIDYPDAGEWWILVQNWEASDNPPDAISMAMTLVASDAGNMWVDGPESVPAGEPFDLRVYWDEPELEAGATWYGAISLGTDPANPGNIGTIFVNLHREADDVTKVVSTDMAHPGDTVTYQIVVENNITPEDLTYTLTDMLPAGLTYVEGSASATDGTVSVAGNTLTWTGVKPSVVTTPGSYIITSNADDAQCGLPLGDGGYYDFLSNNGFTTEPGIEGDTDYWQYSSHAGTDFYGSKRAEAPKITDDGMIVFGEWSGQPWVNQDLPDPTPPNGLLAPYWRDMEIVYDAATNKGLTVAGIPGVLWIAEFDDIQAYEDPTTHLDMEVLSWMDADPTVGIYDVYYAFDNVNVADTTGTIGVENDAGDAATQFAYNNFTPTDGLVLCLDYVGPAATVITFDAVVNADATTGVVTNEVVHDTDNPGSKPATASTELTVEEAQSCGPMSTNLLSNGNFEAGQSGWLFYSSGAGSFSTTPDAAECDSAAHVAIVQSGSNVQLYQPGITLEANTTYRLTFLAASPSGADMAIVMHNHVAPYQFYGLAVNQVDLTPEWQRYTVEFTTENIAGTVNTARLRFWFAPFAHPGDIYMIDDVRLEKKDGTESELPAAVAAAAVSTSDPTILDSIAAGNVVDSESALLPVYLPLIQQ